jgi:anti-sigma regulatory factor (Ser/Thr protein kinase)
MGTLTYQTGRFGGLSQGLHVAGKPLVDLELPADRQLVSAARRQVIAACERVGLSDAACATLNLALGEALANAVTHGAPTNPDHAGADIRIAAWHYARRIIVQVTDHGPGFEPPPPPFSMPFEEGRTAGRGLALMQMLTDAMVVCAHQLPEPGVTVYLIVNMQPPSPSLGN